MHVQKLLDDQNDACPQTLVTASHRRGGALITTVIVMATLSLILGTLMAGARQRMHLLRIESDQTKALAIAEAGMNETFDLLVAQPELMDGANPIAQDESFAGGSYTVNATAMSNNVVLLEAIGSYGGREVTVMATVVLRLAETGGGSEGPTGLLGPFGPVGLLAGGTLTLSGGIHVDLEGLSAHANGRVVFSGGPNLSANNVSSYGPVTLSGNPQIHLNGGGGRLHANGPVDLRGTINAAEITSSTSINGNWGANTWALNIAPTVTWPAWFNPRPPEQVAAVDTVAQIPLPALDQQAFEAHAQTHGYHYSGNQDLTRSWLTADILRRTGVNVNNNATTITPAGGVLFINGNVTVSQDMLVEGMIFATGNITIGGAARLENPTPYPALVSSGGNISIGGGSGGPDINGWVYAMNGSVTAGGGSSGLTGIVAAHNLTVTAGYTLGNWNPESSFISPGQTVGGGGGGGGTSGETTDASITLLAWLR